MTVLNTLCSELPLGLSPPEKTLLESRLYEDVFLKSSTFGYINEIRGQAGFIAGRREIWGDLLGNVTGNRYLGHVLKLHYRR